MIAVFALILAIGPHFNKFLNDSAAKELLGGLAAIWGMIFGSMLYYDIRFKTWRH